MNYMSELSRLRDAERRVMRQLDSRQCVGIHRDIAYRELRIVRGKIKRAWAEYKSR